MTPKNVFSLLIFFSILSGVMGYTSLHAQKPKDLVKAALTKTIKTIKSSRTGTSSSSTNLSSSAPVRVSAGTQTGSSASTKYSEADKENTPPSNGNRKRTHEQIEPEETCVLIIGQQPSGQQEGQRASPYKKICTRNYPKLMETITAAEQQGASLLIREAQAWTPYLSELYRGQYQTASGPGQITTPQKAVTKVTKKKTTHLSTPQVQTAYELLQPGEHMTPAVYGYTVTQQDWIDPFYEDETGTPNIQRMLQGLAPIGPDGLPINLHHVLQQDPGPLAELSGSLHRRESTLLHFAQQGIQDRSDFNIFRQLYWQARGHDMLESIFG